MPSAPSAAPLGGGAVTDDSADDTSEVPLVVHREDLVADELDSHAVARDWDDEDGDEDAWELTGRR